MSQFLNEFFDDGLDDDDDYYYDEEDDFDLSRSTEALYIKSAQNQEANSLHDWTQQAPTADMSATTSTSARPRVVKSTSAQTPTLQINAKCRELQLQELDELRQVYGDAMVRVEQINTTVHKKQNDVQQADLQLFVVFVTLPRDMQLKMVVGANYPLAEPLHVQVLPSQEIQTQQCLLLQDKCAEVYGATPKGQPVMLAIVKSLLAFVEAQHKWVAEKSKWLATIEQTESFKLRTWADGTVLAQNTRDAFDDGDDIVGDKVAVREKDLGFSSCCGQTINKVGMKLYVTGGVQAESYVSTQSVSTTALTCLCFDLSTNEWTRVAKLSKSLNGHQSVLIDREKLLIFGGHRERSHYRGSHKRSYQQLTRIDLKRSSITSITVYVPTVPMSPPTGTYDVHIFTEYLQYHTATKVDEYIYVIGGTDSYQTVIDTNSANMFIEERHIKAWPQFPRLLQFNPLTNHFVNLIPQLQTMIPVPILYGHTATAVGQYIVIHGGFCNEVLSSDTFLFDTKHLTWSKMNLLGEPVVPRAHHDAIRIFDTIIFIGGRSSNVSYPTTLECLDLKTKEIRIRECIGNPTLMQREKFQTCLLRDGSLFLHGGYRLDRKCIFRKKYGDTVIPAVAVETAVVEIGARARFSTEKSTMKSLLPILKRSLWSDCSLILNDNRSIALHRVVLQCRCPILLDLIEHQQSTQPIENDHFLEILSLFSENDDARWAVLVYLYSGAHLWRDNAENRRRVSVVTACTQLAALLHLSEALKSCKETEEDFRSPFWEELHLSLNDIFAGVFDTNAVERQQESPSIDRPVVDDPPLRLAMANLYDNDSLRCRFADFKVLLDNNESIDVHKCVLCRSSMIAAVLNANMKESVEGCMKLENMSISVAKSFLRFLYCGQLVCEPEDALDLVAAGARFHVSSLTQQASSFVEAFYDFTEISDLMSILIVAYQSHAHHLYKVASTVLTSDFDWETVKDVMRTMHVPDVWVVHVTRLFVTEAPRHVRMWTKK